MLIESSQLQLRPLTVEDADQFYTWAIDREVTQYSLSSYAYPQAKGDIASWLAGVNSQPKSVSFGICCRESGRLIGYAGIVGISQLNRNGEYFILIGDKTYWGRGLGTQVTQLVTHYGFNDLGLHRIELTVYANNSAALSAYQKAGYVQEGVKRQCGYRNGEFLDQVQMSILAHEWRGLGGG